MQLLSVSGLSVITLLGQFPHEQLQIPEPNESNIPFYITESSAPDALQTLDGRNWRHNFDMILTSSNDVVSIFDEFGVRHDFELSYDATSLENSFSPLGNQVESSHLEQDGNTIRWTRTSGSSVEFYGSLPYRINRPNSQTLNLDYHQGQLTRVSGEHSDSLLFHYTNGVLDRVEAHEARYSCEQLNHDIPSSSPPSSNRCDNTENPAPESTRTPSFMGALAIDLRPASCHSYFIEYFGTMRGQEIEYGLDTHARYQHYVSTVRSFPIVDLIGEHELLTVRSRDLTSASYDPTVFPDGLYQRLLEDAMDIQDRFITPLQTHGTLETIELGESTRVDSDILERPMVLEIIIRHGFASPEQIAQINRARADIELTYGIELRIIEIP